MWRLCSETAFELSSPSSQTYLEVEPTTTILNTKNVHRLDKVIDTVLPAVSLLKIPSRARGDIRACVAAAHVYHPPPQALSAEREMLARVQLCKSHLDVAFVINNLRAWLPPFLFSLPALLFKPLQHCSQAPQQPLICLLINAV